MRDAARIDRICALIGNLWKQHPDQRLFQLLMNATWDTAGPVSGTEFPRESADFFQLEDTILEKALRVFTVFPLEDCNPDKQKRA